MQKPNDIGKYTEAELYAMDFRELDAHAEAWSRIFCVREGEEWEREYSRMATRVFITRREVLRKVVPDLVGALAAIQARINGNWDDKDLLKFGPLTTDPKADILEIARIALAKTDPFKR